MRPINIPIAAKSDANGNATFDLRLERTGDWRLIRVTMAADGYGTWDLLKSGGLVNSSFGPRCVMGPEVLEPQDTLSVQLTGAAANTDITGTVAGRAGTMEETLPLWMPQSSPVAVDTTSPLTAAAFQAGTSTFTVPAGGVSLLWRRRATTFAGSLTITGATTGIVYASMPGLTSPAAGAGAVLDIADAQLTVVVTGSTWIVDVWTVPQLVANQPGTASVTPAPWQAALSSVVVKSILGAGGTVTPIAGVAGQIIRVLGINLSFDAAAAGADLLVIDGAAGGTQVGAISATAIPVPPQPWYGLPLSAGNGLTLQADGAGLTVRGTILYTQS